MSTRGDSVQKAVFKGVLIAQSVNDPKRILRNAKVVDTRTTTLEAEDFRGRMLFYCVEVAQEKLWPVLREVAETIKTGGWYFHLVGNGRIYIVMSRAVLFADNDDELKEIERFVISRGTHPAQVNLKVLLKDPYA